MSSAAWNRRGWLGAAISVVALGACSTAPSPGATAPAGSPAPAPVTVVVTQTASAAAPTPTTTTTSAPPKAAAPAAPSWTRTVAAAGPAVARLDVLGCDARWMGSGFVVGVHLLMTANHVAEGASAITVQYDGGVTTAEVVGLDPSTDSALLRTKGRLPGKSLRLLDGPPARAEELGVLGFPLETYELRFSKGTVSALHEPVEVLGHEINMIVTDTAINPGNSGGPAIDVAGRVVGLVSAKRLWITGGPEAQPAEGQGYVVPSTSLLPNLERWRASEPMPAASCGGSVPPPASDSSIRVQVNSDDALAPDIARSLGVHAEAINSGNYQAAWQVFTPAMQRSMGNVDKWSKGLVTSLWTDLAVNTVDVSGSKATVGVSLVTTQDASHGHDGQTCSVWDMTYTMVNQQGGWLIDKAKASPGSPTAC